MKLSINGEIKSIDPEKGRIYLSHLIEDLGYHPKLVVVELNKIIINSENWDKIIVKDGDSMEIVTIVGGGY